MRGYVSVVEPGTCVKISKGDLQSMICSERYSAISCWHQGRGSFQVRFYPNEWDSGGPADLE